MKRARAHLGVFRRWSVLITVGLALGLVVSTGGYLRYTQQDAATKLRNDFGQRARIAAGLTAGLLSTTAEQNRSFATATFAMPVEQLQAAVTANTQPGIDLVILGPDGGVLASASAALHDDETIRTATAGVAALARQTGAAAFSDLSSGPDGPKFWMALPYVTPFGNRMFLVSVPVAQISMLIGAYLGSSLGVTGGQAMMIDSTGVVLLSTAGATVGQPIPDTAVAAALRHTPAGTANGHSYVEVPVAGSRWNIVLITSENVLLAPIRSTKRVAWQLFGAFVVALLLMLALGARLLLSSARLAHARLHDTLTGLPNRALFLAQTERAIHECSASSDTVAALFLDLDGFKPVNDRYGHAAGDALLAAVAERLTASIRPGDLVSRFGGDEFLILCPGLPDESTASAVADRIQATINEPFTIDGLTVSIGVSIGLAVFDEHTTEASDLIRNADLAMYHAKRAGRGHTARFQPAMMQ